MVPMFSSFLSTGPFCCSSRKARSESTVSHSLFSLDLAYRIWGFLHSIFLSVAVSSLAGLWAGDYCSLWLTGTLLAVAGWAPCWWLMLAVAGWAMDWRVQEGLCEAELHSRCWYPEDFEASPASGLYSTDLDYLGSSSQHDTPFWACSGMSTCLDGF